jgi:diphthamide biosynthesis enzyme Dph1/Dph2-like protein
MYAFEIDEVIKEIGRSKRVALQLPDGLKPRAEELVVEIEEKTGVRPHVFLGSNFGACDIPSFLDREYDLLVHFGHTPLKW